MNRKPLRMPLFAVCVAFAFALPYPSLCRAQTDTQKKAWAGSSAADADFHKGVAAEQKGDYAGAMALYSKAAKAGSAFAVTNLGIMCLQGHGTTKNEAEAVKMFRKSAAAGEPAGLYNLGYVTEHGIGTATDEAQSVKYYRQSADGGDVAAMNNLGHMYEGGHGIAKSDAEAVKWYRKASEAGDTTGMSNLAAMYIDGTGGRQKRRGGHQAASQIRRRRCAGGDEQPGLHVRERARRSEGHDSGNKLVSQSRQSGRCQCKRGAGAAGQMSCRFICALQEGAHMAEQKHTVSICKPDAGNLRADTAQGKEPKLNLPGHNPPCLILLRVVPELTQRLLTGKDGCLS